MNKDEIKIATLFGPEYIPLFRRKQRERKKDMFCHSDVMELVVRSEHRHFNAEEALGDTIKEKFESLYMFIVHITTELLAQKIVADTMIADTEAISIFDLCFARGWSSFHENKDIVRIRNINNRWMLYKDRILDGNIVLLTQRELNKGIVIKINWEL